MPITLCLFQLFLSGVVPMIQQLESTLRAGAVPQAPQFRPSAVASSIQTGNTTNKSASATNAQSTKTKNEDADRKSETESRGHGEQQTQKKTGSPCDLLEKPSDKAVAKDPLGDARSKVQQEISSEFAAIMATGTLRASEAAALATRRVMQRYGHMSTAQS